MDWYAVYTSNGVERRVKRDIEHAAHIEGHGDKLGEVFLAEERYVETKGDKKVNKTRNIVPGYIFIRCESDDELFKVISEVNGVFRFAGDKPTKITDQEVEDVRAKINTDVVAPKPKINLEIGDRVKIVSGGALGNMGGTVEKIDHERAKVKIMVDIFGRMTPSELDATDVYKV
jgi:transcriptional antiterminator NusG